MRVIVHPLWQGRAIKFARALRNFFQHGRMTSLGFQGFVDERSTHHAAGWVRCVDVPAMPVEVEMVLRGGRVLARLRADQFSRTLLDLGINAGMHGFYLVFPRPLTEAERDGLGVRVVVSGKILPLAPALKVEFQPIAHLALDIVNNCNLRCPFCVVDYSATRHTQLMSDATFAKALALIPYVTDGNFWLSCLHEATLHPKLLDFIARVPWAQRRKLFFTTNLAKRLPDSFFAALCDAGMHHLNISIESVNAAIYEKMRAGARFAIFAENWNRLLTHHASGKAPPKLRYNIMCYRSNLHDIPGLVRQLLDEKRAWQVELRHTYDVAHIPQDFRQQEFLSTTEWAWLKAALADFDPARVLLLLPPGELGYDPSTPPMMLENAGDDAQFSPFLTEGEAVWNRAPRPFHVSMNWQGMLRVYGSKPEGGAQPDRFICYAKTNIHYLANPLAFLAAL